MRVVAVVLGLVLPLRADVSTGAARCGNRVQGFELQLSLDKRRFIAGEPIPVRWTLVNFYQARTYDVPRDWDRIFPKAEDHVAGAEGLVEFRPIAEKWTLVIGPDIPRRSGTGRMFSQLKTNGRRSGEFTVETQENLPPGTYDVKLVYYSRDRQLIIGSNENLTSNTLRIEILK